MQNPVKERIAKLRDEIAQISEENRLFSQSRSKVLGAVSDQDRRRQRLREIPDELAALTDWKKL